MTNKDDMTVMMGPSGGSGSAEGGVLKPPKAKLICLDDSLLDASQKGLEIFLDEAEVTMGRGEENTHPIRYSKISRVHARVFPSEGKWGVEDLKSTNGVWINDVRVTKEPLKPGDYLRIGAVPFRFVLERPEAGALSGGVAPAGESEHTMMFGAAGSGAADALSRAKAAAESEPERAKPAAIAARAAPSSGRTLPTKSKTPLLAVVGVVILLVVGGLGYVLTRGPGGEEEAAALRKQFKEFSYTYEEPSGAPSAADLASALTEISRMREDAQQASEKFAKNPDFRGLVARAIFLGMERNFYKMVQAGRTDQLLATVSLAVGQVTALKPTGTTPMPEEITQTLEVLVMAQSIAIIKEFRRKFPEPGANASPKPTAQEFAVYQQARDVFVAKKRNPMINSVLSVAYAFFGRLVTSVDQTDMPQLDRWKEYIR